MFRALSSILLSLVLVLTSQSMATARMAEQPTDRMVICSGFDTVTILVDARGNPVSAPHFCPDCALFAIPAPTTPALTLRDAGSFTRLGWVDTGMRRAQLPFEHSRVRGPPLPL